MKVTVSLTIGQAAFFMNTQKSVKDKRKGYSNYIVAKESFETQVLEQVVGTKYFEKYASLRRNPVVTYIRVKDWHEPLPVWDRPIFPYSNKFKEMGIK